MERGEAEKRLELIASLAKDVRSGIKDIVFPFFVFGVAAVAGTFASYALNYAEYGGFIPYMWIGLMSLAGAAVGIQARRKPVKRHVTDRLFAALWTSIGVSFGAVMLLGAGLIPFGTIFFILSLFLVVGYVTSAAVMQSSMLYALAGGWLAVGIACLFVPPTAAPLVMASGAFLFELVPASVVLVLARRNVRGQD